MSRFLQKYVKSHAPQIKLRKDTFITIFVTLVCLAIPPPGSSVSLQHIFGTRTATGRGHLTVRINTIDINLLRFKIHWKSWVAVSAFYGIFCTNLVYQDLVMYYYFCPPDTHKKFVPRVHFIPSLSAFWSDCKYVSEREKQSYVQLLLIEKRKFCALWKTYHIITVPQQLSETSATTSACLFRL